MCCFNCGSSTHNLRDCKIKRDRDCVQMNRTWMQAFARIGAKRERDHEVHSRSRSRFAPILANSFIQVL